MATVSVVIPAYNQAALLRETLQSVADQTFAEWECLVVDDGSTDNTREVVEEFARRDARFRYLWQNNGERCRARNQGLSLSEAEFVAFLDHDDLWKPTFLEETVAYLRAHPEAGLVFAYGYHWNGRENIKEACLPEPENPDVYEQIIAYGSLFTPVNALIRRSAAVAVGGFRSEWVLAEDFEYWLRFGRSFPMHVLKRHLALYRLHGGNAASQSMDWLHVQRRLMRMLAGDPDLEPKYRRAARLYLRKIRGYYAEGLLKNFMGASTARPGDLVAWGLQALWQSPRVVWRERWVLRALAKRMLRPGRAA